MAVNIKNLWIGILAFGFMMLALFGFANDWAGEHGVSMSGDAHDINSNLNDTLNTMYATGESESEVVTDSNVYSGGTDLGIITTDVYQNLKNSFNMMGFAMNITTNIARIGIFPSYLIVFAISVLTFTVLFLILAAIFRAKSGLI